MLAASRGRSAGDGARGFGPYDPVAEALIGDLNCHLTHLEEWIGVTILHHLMPQQEVQPSYFVLPELGERAGPQQPASRSSSEPDLSCATTKSDMTRPASSPLNTSEHRLLQNAKCLGGGDESTSSHRAGQDRSFSRVKSEQAAEQQQEAMPNSSHLEPHPAQRAEEIEMQVQQKKLQQEASILRGQTKNCGRDWNFFSTFTTPRSVSLQWSDCQNAAEGQLKRDESMDVDIVRERKGLLGTSFQSRAERTTNVLSLRRASSERLIKTR